MACSMFAVPQHRKPNDIENTGSWIVLAIDITIIRVAPPVVILLQSRCRRHIT